MKPTPQSLSGLIPFIRPYRVQVALAGVFLLLAAGTTLAFPWALRTLIDQGLAEQATPEVLRRLNAGKVKGRSVKVRML